MLSLYLSSCLSAVKPISLPAFIVSVLCAFVRVTKPTQTNQPTPPSQTKKQEMLEALENDPSPDAGTALDPSRRFAGVAAAGLTYWAAASATGALVRLSRREGVAIWALVVGALAYVFLSTVFVFYVYARKCFSKPAAARSGGGGRGRAAENGEHGGVALVGGSRDGGGDKGAAEAGGTTEFSRLLGGGASSRETDQIKDR